MKSWILLLVILFLMTSCLPASPQALSDLRANWAYQDLRLLDPIDAPDSAQDLIALYTRTDGKDFQIRLDFLDSKINNRQDLYLVLDTMPGGSSLLIVDGDVISVDLQWEIALIFPAVGNVRIFDNNYKMISGMGLLIVLDESQDNVLVRFNKDILPINSNLVKLQVLVAPKEKNNIIDKTLPVSLDSPPPAKVQIAFVFWNSINTKTPAGTLRSWAGAHSGPGGERHGLSYLLDAAKSTNTPLIFLDLQEPDKIATLEYLNATSLINDLEDINIVNSWNIVDHNLAKHTIQDSFRDENYLNMLFNELWFNKELIEYDYAHITNNTSRCAYMLNAQGSIIHNEVNLSECKSDLITSAIQKQTDPILFGGDLSKSYLGKPELNYEFFSYINKQPWIEVLSSVDIVVFSDSNSISREKLENPMDPIIYREILKLPKNILSDLSLHIFQELTHQSTPSLESLSINYINSIRFVNEAAKWAANPSGYKTCDIDIDLDGTYECVLANQKFFVIIEPKGGYIPFAFARDEDGLHQIIGPTWELMLGISDPSTWDTSQGLLSDPDQILGAIYDNNEIEINYNTKIVGNRVDLDSNVVAMRKSFELTDHSIIIQKTDTDIEIGIEQIPIVLDPWTKYTKNWGNNYYALKTPNTATFGIQAGVSIELISTVPLTIYAFNDSMKFMCAPEKPNFDYSRGHSLPYPLFLAVIHTSSDYSIELTINPSENH